MSEELPDGWGAGTPRDDTVVRAYIEAYADFVAALGAAGDAHTHRGDDWAAMDAHVPSPFANAAVLLRPVHDAADPLLDDVQAFFRPDDHDSPYLVWSATPTPSLADRGWTLMGHPPLMLRPPAPATPPRPDRFELVEIRDREQLATFDQTLVEAYPVPGMEGARMFGDRVLDLDGWHMWLGVLEGVPVGTAAAHVTDAFVDVEWISAKPSARGKRIGEALTWAATLVEPERPAMLIASDLGQPVYERMGYLRLSRCTLWVGTRGS